MDTNLQEYANEPEEEYMDAEEQLVGLSGGLNGPQEGQRGSRW